MRGIAFPRLWLGGVLLLFSVAGLAENAVTTDVASMRAGPDDSYPEVAQLDPDSPIQVMGCLDDWSWCDVAYGDDRGWLYAPDISYEYEGGYVPFYAYAPSFGLPVVSFSLGAYWGSYYRGRPWYGQRDEWIHRSIHHRRPTGPEPSRALPPREVVRAARPHGGSHPPMHLSRAEPGHRDEDRAAPPPRAEHAPQHEERAPARPQERELRPQERSAPQREEQHSHPTEHAPQSQHAEPRGSPKPGSPSHKDENDHRG